MVRPLGLTPPTDSTTLFEDGSMNRELMERLGKEAAARVRNTTSHARTYPVSEAGGREAALSAMKADPPPASHQHPTRLGRKPYKRTK